MGDVVLDGYASGTVERISPEAPVPILHHMSNQEVPGGAANVAMNIAALGGSVGLVGVVGTDEEAKRLETMLTESGIETHFIRSAERPTTSKLRILVSNHQMLRIDREEVSDINPDDEDRVIVAATELLAAADAIILSDYRKGCLTDKVLQELIDAAVAAGVPVFIDPKRKDFRKYRGATYLTPNRSELAAATGMACDGDDSCRLAAEQAIEQTGATILLTRSERGMVLFPPRGQEIWLPTEAKEVFDVSGAGDSVIATFAYALANGTPVAQALRIANCAAGIVIGKAGTATTTQAEIIAVMEREHADVAPANRIADLTSALRLRAEWKAEKLLVGFTNGCFDLLHPGHIALLREAAQECDRLIVGLNSDASVRRLKGASRPVQDENARADVMASIRHVDLVVLFEDDTPQKLIEALRPDFLIKGSDYEIDEIVGADFVMTHGGKVKRVNLKPGHSTTNLVAKSQSQ
ncbi:D-beta-D-heptose 7-phosphate kinase/D-beta-D-heptose 1-phosphate adenosyltransferase [Sphingobium sp. B11D3B]|nr:D-beta-D-heptose 7-phosphate kinase/D-beta-D-heptose 1-phosphate adenosyltransferase [Sphingobium sp. B11D3B]